MNAKILWVVITGILLLCSCKKEQLNEENTRTQFFLPETITISNAIEPARNGTVQFTYNTNRQITGIKRMGHAGNEISSWLYTYDAEKRLTHVKYTLDNPLSHPSHMQTDYTYEYTGNVPARVTVLFSNNLGDAETVVADITKPAPDRFTLWTTSYTYTPDNDWLTGSGSLIEGSGVAATYTDKEGVFADVEKSAAHHFFLDRHNITYLLLLSKKELASLQVNIPSSAAYAGNYNSITVSRNPQDCIVQYLIKNDSKTYAQFDIVYKAVQP